MKKNLSTFLISIVVSVIMSLVSWGALTHITKNSTAINDGYSQFTVYLTLTTLIATILAIAIAVVFSVNWLLMDKKLRGAVNSALENIDEKVHSELDAPLQATTGFLVALMDEEKYGADEMSEQVQRQLSVWEFIPNARTYVAGRYVTSGYTITDQKHLLESNKENLNAAMTWIEMAKEHLYSEDLRKLHFLEALRAAILNAPDFCLASLNKLKEVSPDNNFDDLLSMPYAKEFFSLCGTRDDSLRICKLLSISPSNDDLEQALNDLTSSSRPFLCLLSRLENTDTLFNIQVSPLFKSYILNPTVVMTRSNTPEDFKLDFGSSTTNVVSKLKDSGYVVTAFSDVLLYKSSEVRP